MARQDQTIRYSVEVDGTPALKSVADGLTAIADAGGPAAEQATKLLEELKQFASQNSLVNQFVADKAALADLGDQMNATGAKLNELKDRFAATTTPSAALSRSISNTESSLASLSSQFGAQQAQLAKTGNALEAAGIDTNNLDAAQRKVQSSIAGVTEQAATLGATMGGAAVATEEAGTKAGKSASLFGTLANNLGQIVTIAAAVSLALKAIEFGAESVKGAAAVESSLARVQALAQGAAGQFEQLDKSVEEAAIAVNTTTQNAAGGLAALVSQGLSANDAMAALIPTLQLAKIANIDVGTAAADVAGALKAFNIPATEAASVVDALTTASHGAAGGLGAMASAAAQLAPDAKSIGLSLTDTIGILGLLESKGLDTEKAVRGLRTVFQDLENPTSTLRGDLLSLGDGTSDFGQAIAALNSKTPQAQKALLSLAGPARSLVEVLGQAGPGALAAFTAGLQNTAGAASATSKALDATLSGSFSAFEHSIDLIGEKLASPILKPFADEFTKLADQLNTFAESDDFKAIADQVGKMATDAAKSLDTLINDTDWKGFASNGLAAIKNLQTGLEDLGKSASTVATVIGKTADTIGIAYHGLGTALSVVVAGFAQTADKFVTAAQVIDALTEGTDKAAKKFEDLHAAVQTLGDAATDQAKKHLDDLGGSAKDLAGNVDTATTATTAQGKASATAAPQIQQHADATQAAADATTAIIDPLRVVPNYFKAAGDSAGDAAPGIESLRTEVQKIGGGPLQDAQEALLKTSKAFADLQASSDATPEAIDNARAAFIAASKDLAKLEADAQGAGSAMVTAFNKLGIASQEALKLSIKNAQDFFNTIKNGSDQSTAGLADVANAFLASAAKQLAAAAQLDSATQQTTKSSLEQQAAALGLSDKLQALENQAGKAGTALEDMGGSRASKNLDDVSDAASRTTEKLGEVSDEAKDAQQQLDDVGSDGGDSLGQLDQALQNTRQQLLDVSDAAAAAFDAKLPADFFDAFDSTGIGFAKVIEGMNQASADVTAEITNQRTQLQGEIADINNLGQAGSTNFGQFGDSAAAAAAKMTSLAQLIASGNYDAGLLGQQELGPLQQALEAAAQRAQQLVDQVKAANDALNQLAQDTQDALDQEEGNDTAIEDRRHQKELDDLQAAAKAANQLNSQVYLQAVQQENQLHALKLKNIAAQQAAQNGSSNSGSGSSASKPNGGIGSGGDSSDGTGNAGFGGTNVQAPVINFHGDIIGTDPKSLAKYLSAAIVSELKAVQSRTIGPLLGKAP
jgi:TP901 family phage tail tape measure protein